MIEVQVPKLMATPEQLRRFASLFIGRTSDLALQQSDGRYQRIGRPLTQTDIIYHLWGTHTLGTYVITDRGMCRFAVFDADTNDGLDILAGVQQGLEQDGYISYLEQSRRGGHLWLFFERPLPASQVRSWFLPYRPKGIEFYPKQDEGEGYGSLIRVPLGAHRLTDRRYPFVEKIGNAYIPIATSFPTLLNWLFMIKRIPVPAERLQPVKPARGQAPTHKSLASSSLRLLSYSANSIHAWCEMQDPFQVIGSYVSLNAQGIGCCPFGDHHRSGQDRHPSFKVYEPKFVGGSSWYCYTWGKGGNVFDFLCHWYNVDARTMWHRIQTGEVVKP